MSENIHHDNRFRTTSFKRRVAEWIIKWKQRGMQRDRKLVPFEEVKKIGLLFGIVSKEEFGMIQDLSQYLISKGKEVISIGYYPGKDLPDYCIAAKSGYCFNQRDVSFLEFPKTDFLRKYIQIPFDLLINLCQDDHLPLKYTATLSRAKIKMGITRGNDQGCYDITIQPEKKLSLDKAIENVFHYLLILNRKEDSI